MIQHKAAWVAIALMTLASACTPAPETAKSDPVAAEAAPMPPDAGTRMTAAAVLVSHRVTDYEAWKAAFEADRPAREEGSCLGHYLKRGVDDPDLVYVYCLATDGDKLRAFLESSELAETMRKAGVSGEPTVTLMKPMSRNLVSKQRLPGIIVFHQVEDYATWRVAYDALDEFRRESGIVGHAVTQGYDDPYRVVVYHQADELDDLRAFVDSPELKEAMRRGGVVGEPEIHFIQVVDFAAY